MNHQNPISPKSLPSLEEKEESLAPKPRKKRLAKMERREVALGAKCGRLTVTKIEGGRAEAICDCGKFWSGSRHGLYSGMTSSCGCLYRESRKTCAKTHGHKCGGKVSKIYTAWQSMKTRCYLSIPVNHRYVERGIKVCSEWEDNFEAFAAYIGEPPSPTHTVERINNDGSYEPGNVKWATRKEQGNNKINNVRLTAFGKTQTLPQWADEIGISHGSLRLRLKRGWTVEKAVSTKALTK